MRRRDFLQLLGLGTAGVFVPQFGRWHKQGSGALFLPPVAMVTASVCLNGKWCHVERPLSEAEWREGKIDLGILFGGGHHRLNGVMVDDVAIISNEPKWNHVVAQWRVGV